MARDAQWEETWRDHLARRVSVLYDVSISVLDRIVVERLTAARSRYGDDGYLDRDIVKVAVDKTADAVACALLETQKRLRSGHAAGLEDLEQAAIHSAMADHYFRRAGRAHLNV